MFAKLWTSQCVCVVTQPWNEDVTSDESWRRAGLEKWWYTTGWAVKNNPVFSSSSDTRNVNWTGMSYDDQIRRAGRGNYTEPQTLKLSNAAKTFFDGWKILVWCDLDANISGSSTTTYHFCIIEASFISNVLNHVFFQNLLVTVFVVSTTSTLVIHAIVGQKIH